MWVDYENGYMQALHFESKMEYIRNLLFCMNSLQMGLKLWYPFGAWLELPKTPSWKFHHRISSNLFRVKCKRMKLNWSFISQKHHTSAFIQAQIQSTANTPYFSAFWNWILVETHENPHEWKKATKWYCLCEVESQINSEKTIFLLFSLVIGNKSIIYNVGCF